MKNVETKFKNLLLEIKSAYSLNEMPLTPTGIQVDKIAPTEESTLIKVQAQLRDSDILKTKQEDKKMLKIEEDENETNYELSELYPNSNVKRFKVESRYKKWFVKYRDYDPVRYTAKDILLKPEADLDLIS